MIYSNIFKQKTTANEAAKQIILSFASKASYWDEAGTIDWDRLTAKERNDINRAIDKQWARVQKLLGYHGWGLG